MYNIDINKKSPQSIDIPQIYSIDNLKVNVLPKSR